MITVNKLIKKAEKTHGAIHAMEEGIKLAKEQLVEDAKNVILEVDKEVDKLQTLRAVAKDAIEGVS